MIQRIDILILVISIRKQQYISNKFVIVIIYLLRNKGITIIQKEIYLVNNLIVNILIRINIIKLEKIILYLTKEYTEIKLYNNIYLPLTIYTKGL